MAGPPPSRGRDRMSRSASLQGVSTKPRCRKARAASALEEGSSPRRSALSRFIKGLRRRPSASFRMKAPIRSDGIARIPSGSVVVMHNPPRLHATCPGRRGWAFVAGPAIACVSAQRGAIRGVPEAGHDGIATKGGAVFRRRRDFGHKTNRARVRTARRISRADAVFGAIFPTGQAKMAAKPNQGE